MAVTNVINYFEVYLGIYNSLKSLLWKLFSMNSVLIELIRNENLRGMRKTLWYIVKSHIKIKLLHFR